jgi:hypothetical protein
MMKLPLVTLIAATLGCTPVRFADRAVLWHDADDAPIPLPPKPGDRGTGRLWPGARSAIFEPADRLFAADYGLESVNVNALDEVPDSSWYQDPRRDPADPGGPPRALTAQQMARGPVVEEPPRLPFRVVSTLRGGSAPGFVVDDRLGRRYALKLDPEGHPGMVSGADVVATRLAWASGWRVPATEIVEISRSDLVVTPESILYDSWGQRHPLDGSDVDAILWHAVRDRNGSYRAVASRWIEGHLLGPFSWLGRNRADANDRFRHENRRDLRGFAVWSSWVDNVDVIDNNTLDSYVGEPGSGHILHYQLDVGGSLGVFAAQPAKYWMGDETYFQAGRVFGSLFTGGIWSRRWENDRWQRRRRALIEQYPEFGGFAAEHFSPREWQPIVDIPPFVRQTNRDRYWGAKRVAAFSLDELRAAVAVAQYRPEAADYLVQTLWQRRNRIARDYFGETTPLDHLRVDGEQLCFVDWWVRAGLDSGSATEYRVRESGHVVAQVRGSGGDGRACLALPVRPGYRVVELAARRPGERHFGRSVYVHLSSRSDPRLLGVLR